MNDLEGKLKSSLRREEPPHGFSERLMQRIAAHPIAKTTWRDTLRQTFLFSKLPAAAIVVSVCFLIVIAFQQHLRYQKTKAEGERAKAQLVLALEIASTKLHLAQKKIQQYDLRQPLPDLPEINQ